MHSENQWVEVASEVLSIMGCSFSHNCQGVDGFSAKISRAVDQFDLTSTTYTLNCLEFLASLQGYAGFKNVHILGSFEGVSALPFILNQFHIDTEVNLVEVSDASLDRSKLFINSLRHSIKSVKFHLVDAISYVSEIGKDGVILVDIDCPIEGKSLYCEILVKAIASNFNGLIIFHDVFVEKFSQIVIKLDFLLRENGYNPLLKIQTDRCGVGLQHIGSL